MSTALSMEGDDPFAKAQTVDPEVRAYVYSLVNAVGVPVSSSCTANIGLSLVVPAPMKTAITCSVTMRWPACEI